MPEPMMRKTGKFAPFDQPCHRLIFEYGIVAVDQIEKLRLTDEKTAVDQTAIRFALFAKALNMGAVVVQVQSTVSPRLHHGGQGTPSVRSPMSGDEFIEIDVAEAVAISQAKGFVPQKMACAAQPPSGHRFAAGINHRHSPVFSNCLRPFHTT